MSRWPLSVWIMGLPGIACLFAGGGLLLGLGQGLHPLLASAGAGLAIVVSGFALIGSAAFPLVFARLAARDGAESSRPDGDADR